MMIALTVTEMEKVRGRPATGHPVLMVLDEFAGLKRMEVIRTGRRPDRWLILRASDTACSGPSNPNPGGVCLLV
jgi:hypothetical protein